MVNPKTTALGMVRVGNGFIRLDVPNSPPFKTGQMAYLLHTEALESLEHELAVYESAAYLPTIRMDGELAKRFPLFLEPRVNGIPKRHILDPNMYCLGADTLILRYLASDAALRIMKNLEEQNPGRK